MVPLSLTQAVLVALQLGVVIAAPTPDAQNAALTVSLDQGTVTGVTNGPSNKFLGIPFAKPPYVPILLTRRGSL